ncbi:MAG: 4-(cytidine 5'-diphospho)-2-C-methyl-D-erythritol kinase [Gemmatimonadaceae bacterium]|nr:4-(cytidine 5'-diphospho)-2-C-methyl-D-erythritol kinase [Gemmatimonadaceae bacterium]
MPDRLELLASVDAWAKINLDLRVLAREETGFHQLETIFQRIALNDRVLVRVRDGAGITLECDVSVGVPEEQNLAWRAAAAYRHAATWPAVDRAIAITVHKQIPTGAGLGGGSADAGAVLRALNALNPAPLSRDALLTVAATLGADVPFLASETVRALAWGRGERMLALDALPQRIVRYAAFRDGVNTALAYRELATARTDGRIPSAGSALLDRHDLGSWADLQRFARNDFEIPVFATRPDIAAVHASMMNAAPSALVRMSGSGATIFAITNMHADEFHAAARTWPDDGSVELRLAVTLETVPPVQILSAPSGPR